jgi:hypothetical protein
MNRWSAAAAIVGANCRRPSGMHDSLLSGLELIETRVAIRITLQRRAGGGFRARPPDQSAFVPNPRIGINARRTACAAVYGKHLRGRPTMARPVCRALIAVRIGIKTIRPRLGRNAKDQSSQQQRFFVGHGSFSFSVSYGGSGCRYVHEIRMRRALFLRPICSHMACGVVRDFPIRRIHGLTDLECFPLQVTRKALQSYRVAAFSDGNPGSTFPENAPAMQPG